jgi:phage/plasmid primase-like uncharacterized protein
MTAPEVRRQRLLNRGKRRRLRSTSRALLAQRASAMIAARLVNRVKAVRIEDEIARRNITLKGRIDQCGPCPVCGGTDRFAINVRKQVYVCRGCRVGGDVISLVQHLDGCAFAEAVEILAGDAPRRTVTLTTDTTAAKKQTVEEYERQQHEKARRM